MTKLLERREKSRKISKDIVVLYHSNCTDGFGGAWAAWKKFGNKAEYVNVIHQTPVPKGLKNKYIYSVDFTYPEPIIKKLISENKRVTAIDHHISAKEVTQLTEKYSYALHHSGSVLSWLYFHPNKPVPKILQYAEDGDLWKFKLPRSREVLAYLDLFNFDFKVWEKLARELENPKKRKKWFENGKLILRHEKKMVDRLLANNTEEVLFAGYKTLAINSADFASELGNLMSKKLPPMGIVWRKISGQILVSLRSNGKADVSKLAQRFGGGGHKAAAGFSLPADAKLPWKSLKKW